MKRAHLPGGILITFLAAFGSLYQTVRYILATPAGYVFPLVHNYEQDYYWYLSLMRQGWDGALAVTTKYSPEQFAGVAVNSFFPVFGALARVTGIGLPEMYTLLRLFGGWMLLFTAFLLIGTLFAKPYERWIAFGLALIGAPLTVPAGGQLRMAGDFWTGLDPVLRVTWLPHHTFANAFVILTLLLVVGRRTARRMPMAVAAVSFGAVWLNPAAGLLIWWVAGLGIAAVLWRKGEHSWIRGMLAALMGSGAALVLLYAAQNSVFPWTAFRDWERYNQYPVTVLIYLEVLGISGITAFAGVYYAVRNRSVPWVMIAAWFLFPFVGLVGADRVLGVSNVRFLQSAGYIPAAMLTVYAVSGIRQTLGWGVHRGRVATILLAAAVCLQSLPAFIYSIRMQDTYVGRNMANPLVMVPSGEMDGLGYLSRTGQSGVVVAPPDVSVLIPAFTPDRVYAGHPTFTYNAPGENKASVLGSLYAGADTAARQQFLESLHPVAVWVPAGGRGWEMLPELGYAKGFANQSEEIWVRD